MSYVMMWRIYSWLPMNIQNHFLSPLVEHVIIGYLSNVLNDSKYVRFCCESWPATTSFSFVYSCAENNYSNRRPRQETKTEKDTDFNVETQTRKTTWSPQTPKQITIMKRRVQQETQRQRPWVLLHLTDSCRVTTLSHTTYRGSYTLLPAQQWSYHPHYLPKV